MWFDLSGMRLGGRAFSRAATLFLISRRPSLAVAMKMDPSRAADRRDAIPPDEHRSMARIQGGRASPRAVKTFLISRRPSLAVAMKMDTLANSGSRGRDPSR
jgi:hypothetical protein